DPSAASTMKDVLAAAAAFQGEIRAVRALPYPARMGRAKELAERYCRPPVAATTGLAVLRLLKDSADAAEDWSWTIGFIDALPADLAELKEVRETYAFALANSGRPMDAIAKLEALIVLSGPSPERLGLLGGRYKRLIASAQSPAERQMYLNKSIDAYERGMELDLNEYYCASNLPRLYRQRRRKGDDERARSVSTLVVAACERAKKRGLADEWLRPTLLGAAFDAGDADKAEELADEVGAEGGARWKLQTTMSDLESSVILVEDKDIRARLEAVLETLKAAAT
ncbi:MAG: DUF4071 domain-containing protein, partial [Hyphomicrobiales bacterium]|nr:DUF4071 domain-containing protein [Hyphomicrobiales bacterium]